MYFIPNTERTCKYSVNIPGLALATTIFNHSTIIKEIFDWKDANGIMERA